MFCSGKRFVRALNAVLYTNDPFGLTSIDAPPSCRPGATFVEAVPDFVRSVTIDIMAA